MISPVRRTTIVVSDMERSLHFYKELLGMKVFYDQEIKAPESAKLLGVPGASTRLVSLQADDCVNGMVGLLQFFTPEIKPRAVIKAEITEPDVAILFMADDIDITATYARLKKAGFEMVCEPIAYSAPERGPISGFTCKDPDGVLVAVMRFGELQQQQIGGTVKASPTRRTTIVVSDMEASIAFYRDVVGMEVFYDQKIDSPEEGKLLGVKDAAVRIVSLQSGDSAEGMVGLMSFESPKIKTRQAVARLVSEPDLCLIFLTDEIEAVHERMVEHGAKVKCAPLEYEIPGRGISAGLTCYDPDGIVLEFTQFGPLKQQ